LIELNIGVQIHLKKEKLFSVRDTKRIDVTNPFHPMKLNYFQTSLMMFRMFG